ncbi:MAG: hypothetical protein ACJAU4_000317 [Glaciecola sp.]|jgi:hypothetical protein
MPKQTKPLTDTQINKAKPIDKDYKTADSDGLYIRIRKGGSKDWLFRYLIPYTVTWHPGLLHFGVGFALNIEPIKKCLSDYVRCL